VEILLATGIRSGRDSMNIRWRHLQWYLDAKTKVRYLRIWVSGKGGGRWLIAKYGAAVVFERLVMVSTLVFLLIHKKYPAS